MISPKLLPRYLTHHPHLQRKSYELQPTIGKPHITNLSYAVTPRGLHSDNAKKAEEY